MTVNRSGEEIFLANSQGPFVNDSSDDDSDDEIHDHTPYKYEVFVYYFSDNEKKHNTLASLAKRCVLTNFTIAELQIFKLASSVKAYLGVL